MMNNTHLPQNEFWNKVAPIKEFKDPFYLAQLKPYITSNSFIIEYGCGYGRLLNFLYENDYYNVKGFDFSEGMIARSKKQFPYLNTQLIKHATLPLGNNSVDAAILSTVLCCVPDQQLQSEIIKELHRVLKPGAVFYFTDFLITETTHMKKKYENDFQRFQEWGVYCSSEGAIVKHHRQDYIIQLMADFKILWYQEEDFITMNNNPVRTFHCLYQK